MRNAQLIERRTNLRENLFWNPSAETNANYYFATHPTGGSGTITRMTDGGYAGSAYIRYTCTTAPSGTTGGLFVNRASPSRIPITTGVTYSASAFIRSATARPYVARIEWYDVSDTKLSTSNGVSVTPADSTTWVQINVTATAPANAVTCTPTFFASGAPAFTVNDYYDLDAVILEASGILPFFPYFDGDSPNARWEGTAHASASLELADVRSRNLIADSAFQYTYKPTLTTSSIGNVVGYFNCPWRTVVDGTMGNCLEYVTNSTINPQGSIIFPQVANAVSYTNRPVTQASGNAYTASAYMLIPSGVTFFLGFRLISNVANASIDGPTGSVVGTGTWQRYSFTSSSIGAGYYVGFQCRASQTPLPPTGTTLRIAQVQVEKAASATAFTATRPDS